ncbi:uncharacterized protein LOC126979826 [Leptidea sinapis]|uniref:uncharacterized protein LOC126979826 n=1 Tax=Leptidea sinapis TaxID=189913 RepID=UPI0021C487C6|nr:uncharacterized protein LOC126979826 [Leptidea sinapis]
MVETFKTGAFQDLFLMTPCVGFVIVALAKSYKIKLRREIFENLVTELRSMWPEGEVSQEAHEVLNKMIKQTNFVVKGYFWCNICLIFFFVSPPYINLIKRSLGHDVPLIFSFFYWTPFDPYQPIIYESILTVQTVQCYTIVLLMLSADLLFFLFVSNITAQFKLLALKIRSMIFVPVDGQLISDYPLAKYIKTTKIEVDIRTNKQHEQLLMNEIKDMVQRHLDLIRL